MALIIPFPRHRLVGRDVPCSCSLDVHCMICDGGLSLCMVCGGAEASMPTDCPGSRMGDLTARGVESGALDYRVRTGWYATEDAQGLG